MKELKNIPAAVQLFEEGAIYHGEASDSGNWRGTRAAYKRIARAASFLKAQNAEAGLLPLLASPSVHVRLWSATYLLPTHAQEAKVALVKAAKGGGLNSLTASTVLSEWRKGKLQLDYE